MDFDGTLIIDILAKVLLRLINMNERNGRNELAVTVPVKFTSSVGKFIDITNNPYL